MEATTNHYRLFPFSKISTHTAESSSQESLPNTENKVKRKVSAGCHSLFQGSLHNKTQCSFRVDRSTAIWIPGRNNRWRLILFASITLSMWDKGPRGFQGLWRQRYFTLHPCSLFHRYYNVLGLRPIFWDALLSCRGQKKSNIDNIKILPHRSLGGTIWKAAWPGCKGMEGMLSAGA